MPDTLGADFYVYRKRVWAPRRGKALCGYASYRLSGSHTVSHTACPRFLSFGNMN